MNQSNKLSCQEENKKFNFLIPAGCPRIDCDLAYGLCAELVVLVGWGADDKRWGRASTLRRLGKLPRTGNMTDTKKKPNCSSDFIKNSIA